MRTITTNGTSLWPVGTGERKGGWEKGIREKGRRAARVSVRGLLAVARGPHAQPPVRSSWMAVSVFGFFPVSVWL
jgi:hypothetical protein